MRQQGLVTASGAKIMAARAVQSASARLPGMSSQFRQQAAAFFGDFGPGTDLLDETEAEKNAAGLDAFLEKEAVKHGQFILGPNGPIVTKEHKDTVRRVFDQTSAIELDNKQKENKLLNGKFSAIDAEGYATNIAHVKTYGILGAMQARIANDGAIMKPEEILKQIGLAKQLSLSAFEKRIQGQTVDTSIVSTMRNNIDSYFKNVESMVTSQSFSTIMKDKKEGVLAFMDVMGAKTFPALAMAERAAPGVGAKLVLDTMQRFENMNAEQKANFMRNDPAAGIVGAYQSQLPALIRGLDNITNGFLPDKQSAPAEHQATLLGATTLAVDKSPDTAPELKHKGIDVLIKSADKGDIQSIHVMGDPRVAANTTPDQRNKLVFSVASETAKVLSTLPYLLSESRVNSPEIDKDALSKVITYDGKEFSYSPVAPATGENGLKKGLLVSVVADNGDFRRTVKSLNAIAKVLRTYESYPEFERALGGKTVDEYLSSMLADVNVKAAEHSAATDEKKKQIESGKIDTWRGATPRESVMPQSGVSELSQDENSDINTQIASLQKRQKDLEAVARKLGATEEDIAGTGPRK
jgi:hypothetical protein